MWKFRRKINEETHGPMKVFFYTEGKLHYADAKSISISSSKITTHLDGESQVLPVNSIYELRKLLQL